MLIYYFVFFLPLFPLLFKYKKIITFFTFFNLIFFIFFIGLKHEVGGDWRNYLFNVNQYYNLSFIEFISQLFLDPLFESIVYLNAKLVFGIYGSNFIFALIFVYGLHKYLKSLPYYFFSFSISVPVLIIVLAMGFTQQSVAFAIYLLAILALRENKFFLFIIYFFIH